MKRERLQAQDAPAGEFEPPKPAELSALLAGYEVAELVACGGMEAVYRAQHVALRREVALKILPGELSQDAEFAQRFNSEARAMVQLTHPNLIAVYDFGEVAGMLFLVMEFVKGDSLFHAAHGQVIDPIQAAEIVAGVAAGLGHAHKAGILHRDIKPANILITEALVPKLGDFGFAVPAGDVASGMVMGSSAYTAPEVLRDPNAATPASDVFSLGMILHELLTGIEPSAGEPADLTRVPALTHLSDLVRKAVLSSPTMRYQNGEDMAEDLREWLEEAGHMLPHGLAGAGQPGAVAPVAPVALEQPHVVPHFSPIVSKRKTGGGVAAVLGVGTVLLIACASLLIFGGGDEERKPGIAEDAAASARPVAAPVVAAPVVKAPPAPPPPASDFDLEAHRSAMRDALRSARATLFERRGANAQALREKAGVSPAWNTYFTMVDHARGGLPRLLTEGDRVIVDEAMAELLNQFALREQGKIDREHLDAVGKLYRESQSVLREAKALEEGGFPASWEAWVEWLGESPVDILALDLVGTWELASGSAEELGTSVVIDREGAVTIVRGGAKRAGKLLDSGIGEWTFATERGDRSWTVRWRSQWLKGTNKAGTPVRFRRQTYRFRPSG